MKVNPPPDAALSGAVLPDAIIVIFGAAVRPDGSASETLRHRVGAAATFGKQKTCPRFIPTGAKGRYGDAESTVMARLLIDAGFPPEAIEEESTGTDTLSSVRAIARMVRGTAPVYACTSAYHLPRCLLLLRLAGIGAKACPPPLVPAATSCWRRWYWRLRETPALPYDALLILWAPPVSCRERSRPINFPTPTCSDPTFRACQLCNRRQH
jgi:vancomycin permeability regulator SanA